MQLLYSLVVTRSGYLNSAKWHTSVVMISSWLWFMTTLLYVPNQNKHNQFFSNMYTVKNGSIHMYVLIQHPLCHGYVCLWCLSNLLLGIEYWAFGDLGIEYLGVRHGHLCIGNWYWTLRDPPCIGIEHCVIHPVYTTLFHFAALYLKLKIILSSSFKCIVIQNKHLASYGLVSTRE